MLKQLAAAVLAICAVSAHAEAARTWNFTWSGSFYISSINEVRDHTFTGSFSAIDADGDNQIVTSELTALNFEWNQILPCTRDECTVSNFSYTGGNALTFSASTYYETPGGPFESWYAYRHSWSVGPAGGGIDSQTYCQQCDIWSFWDARNTTLTVTEVTAVPEPATYAMLGTGLLALLGARRRKGATRRA